MDRRMITGVTLVTIALVLAACAPVTATPPALSGTRSPAGAATGGSPIAKGTGKLFSGTVKHAGQRVPGARVELREVGWAVNQTPPVATVQADAQGAFSFPDPPAGSFSVIGVFPDGEIDAGGWPPVNIAPGQEITGFVVPLERHLTLLSPIAGSVAPASPVLTWRPPREASKYQVWVLDTGTIELLVSETTTAADLTVAKSLKPGVYQWGVNALNEDGEIVATGDETFTVTAPGS